jgi:5-methylcytosine-specific restriction endonuclease McrA
LKQPWLTPDGKKIWKTEAQYWSWLRGSLRRLWSDYPLRKQWKASQLRKITQEEKDSKLYHPSTKNLGLCVYCNTWLAGSKLECDHVQPSDGCTTKGTAESFLWHCGGGTGEDWVLACKPCHTIKSLADKRGITFEEARIEQQVLAITKQSAKMIDEWLAEKRVVDYTKNPKGREKAVRDVLIKEKSDEADKQR